MAITLYGNPMSTCTRKVLTVLAEKKADFNFVVIDFMKAEHKSAEHMARQPFGQVPAIDHDGFGLYESRAIIGYLDELLPGAALTPPEPQGRALMRQWQSVEQSNFTPAVMKIIYQLVFHKWWGKDADMEVVAAGRTGLETTLDVMERALAKQSYLVGEQFTLADIGYMPYIEYVMGTECSDLFTSRPGINAWWQRVSSRPTWQKVIGK